MLLYVSPNVVVVDEYNISPFTFRIPFHHARVQGEITLHAGGDNFEAV